MNRINDGGPAFPVWELNGNEQPKITGFGMAMCDYASANVARRVLTKHGIDWK